MGKLETWQFTDRPPESRDVVFRLEKHGSLLVLYRDGVVEDTKFSTQKDLQVVEYFLRSGGTPFERKELRDEMWPEKAKTYLAAGEVDSDYEIVHQFLRRVRTLLHDSQPWRIIKSVRGKGLQFGGKDLLFHSAESSETPADDVERSHLTPSTTQTSPSKSSAVMFLPLEIPEQRSYQTTTGGYVLEGQGLVVGREKEIAIGRDRWLKDRNRPLLVHGPPGIGKSTLALAILHSPIVAERFGSRRYRLQCDEFLTVNDMVSRIGDKWFGLPAPVKEIEVTAKLSEGPCAVVLDNYETLLQGSHSQASRAWLTKLLGVNDLWLIVSVQGYTRPRGVNWEEPLDPAKLSLPQARELFCRLTDRPSDALDSRLDQMLKDMDGVPLAIELLASWAIHYPDLGPLLTLWNAERTALLQTGLGDARTDNIELVYEFAIRRLDGDAHKLLRILSCLPAGLAQGDLDKVIDGGVGLKASGVLRSAALVGKGDRLKMLAPFRAYIFKMHPPSEAELQPARIHFLRLAGEGKEVGRSGAGGPASADVDD